MRPSRVEVVGDYLALRWEDGGESVVALELLRRACPCARCGGETDITGRVRRVGPPLPLSAESFQLASFEPVGGYALLLRWGDGHDTGIFSFSMLERLAEDTD